jgi:hypothetical protein
MPNVLSGRTYIKGTVSPGEQYSYGVNVSRNTFAYTDTTDKTLFVIPANANICGITLNVQTAFDDSGTNVVDIGKSGTTNHFVNDLSVTAAGQTVTGWSNLGDVGTSDITVVAKYVGQTADATNGQAELFMFWYKD